jgi:putative transcriptional regulator
MSKKKVRSKLSVLMAKKSPPLTQKKVAEDTGLAIQTVMLLYHNTFKRVDNRTVETLCDYFKCDLSDLLRLE